MAQKSVGGTEPSISPEIVGVLKATGEPWRLGRVQHPCNYGWSLRGIHGYSRSAQIGRFTLGDGGQGGLEPPTFRFSSTVLPILVCCNVAEGGLPPYCGCRWRPVLLDRALDPVAG